MMANLVIKNKTESFDISVKTSINNNFFLTTYIGFCQIKTTQLIHLYEWIFLKIYK